MRKKWNGGWLLIIFLALAVLAVKLFQTKATNSKPSISARNDGSNYLKSRGLNRNPSAINYSKHARCRMGCRFIDEQEVQQILASGSINYQKSELGGTECKKKYAVEGTTKDKQRVRIIFAPCQTEVTVVTVIDLGEDWPCECS